MQPDFGLVINRARFHLGDFNARKYKDDYMLTGAREAVDELVTVFGNNQLPQVLLIKLYTLPANTAEIEPAAIPGLPNLGEIELLEEKMPGNQYYTPVSMVDALPQWIPAGVQNYLGVYTHREGKFQFNQIPNDEPLRFTYLASGNSYAADATTNIAIDDSLNFLAYATAAKCGPGKGDTVEADRCFAMAYGRRTDQDHLANPGGALLMLLQRGVREMQQSPIQLPRYRAGGGVQLPSWTPPY